MKLPVPILRILRGLLAVPVYEPTQVMTSWQIKGARARFDSAAVAIGGLEAPKRELVVLAPCAIVGGHDRHGALMLYQAYGGHVLGEPMRTVAIPRRFTPHSGRVVVPARHFECGFYDDCLTYAGCGNWQSWTCKGCMLEPEGIQHEDWGAGDNLAEQRIDIDLSMHFPRRVRVAAAGSLVCARCGRMAGTAVFHNVDGKPACVLCRPDMGIVPHPFWQQALAQAPKWRPVALVGVPVLARALGATKAQLLQALEAGGTVWYRHGNWAAVPTGALGLAARPGPSGASLGPGDLAGWLGVGRQAKVIAAILQGKPVVRWAELALWLALHAEGVQAITKHGERRKVYGWWLRGYAEV